MAVNLADDRLPCGRDIDRLWDQGVTGVRDWHSRSCEYCQAAIDGIRPLREAISELAAEQVRPPADLYEKVMAAVRARIGAPPRIALPGPAGNRLLISVPVVAFIVRAAADTVAGVRARSCQLTPDAHDMSASVSLSISLQFGMPALAAARAVRIAVRTAARAQLGLTLGRIDIDVVDVHAV